MESEIEVKSPADQYRLLHNNLKSNKVSQLGRLDYFADKIHSIITQRYLAKKFSHTIWPSLSQKKAYSTPFGQWSGGVEFYREITLVYHGITKKEPDFDPHSQLELLFGDIEKLFVLGCNNREINISQSSFAHFVIYITYASLIKKSNHELNELNWWVTDEGWSDDEVDIASLSTAIFSNFIEAVLVGWIQSKPPWRFRPVGLVFHEFRTAHAITQVLSMHLNQSLTLLAGDVENGAPVWVMFWEKINDSFINGNEFNLIDDMLVDSVSYIKYRVYLDYLSEIWEHSDSRETSVNSRFLARLKEDRNLEIASNAALKFIQKHAELDLSIYSDELTIEEVLVNILKLGDTKVYGRFWGSDYIYATNFRW